MRDAPSLAILPAMIDKGAKIRAHDPQGVSEARHLLPESITYCEDIYETAKGADALVIMTEWNSYRGLDLKRIKNVMKGNAFIDLRNIYEPEYMRDQGFDYACVGR